MLRFFLSVLSQLSPWLSHPPAQPLRHAEKGHGLGRHSDNSPGPGIVACVGAVLFKAKAAKVPQFDPLAAG